MDKNYTVIDKLPKNWPSYEVQETVNKDGSPTECTIKLMMEAKKRDLVLADEKLMKEEPKLLKRGLQPEAQAPDTVTVEEYKEMVAEEFEM